MGNCLVTKLKGIVNNPDLEKLISNPLKINGIGQGGAWMNEYFPIPVGEYIFLVNTGALYIGASGGDHVTEMPEGYDSMNFEGVWLYKKDGSTRYDVVYPDLFEVIEWPNVNKSYKYNASQNTEPVAGSAGGQNCSHVSLHAGDVLVYNGSGGEIARAIWVMKSDYSATIKVASSGTIATYGPVCYKATEDCEVFLNSSSLSNKSYILRS